MRKLGLIGGIGPESTIPYYHDILYGVQERVGKPYFPPMVIDSLSCFEVMPMASAGKREELAAYLLGSIRNVTAAGADFAAMACNTAHLVFDELERESPIPLVSIVDVTRDRAAAQGYRKVGLLGSIGTMTGGFFQKVFDQADIAIVTPHMEEQTYIEHKLLSEVELGKILPATQEGFHTITARMASEDGIEAVILGCTEIPLIFAGMESPVPVLDTMRIHIVALIEEIMK